MRMVELLDKKRRGLPLSDGEIAWFVRGVTEGSLPDYQVSAMLMAICCMGMDHRETVTLTLEMAASGEMIDPASVKGMTVDKHSTGGVGDKTTLALTPILAACGATVVKMSGRGLGFTGGTIDKLETIPGFRSEMGREEFLAIVEKTGACVVGQSEGFAPADKRLYALRDVTATTDSSALIVSSIMSKKLAAGSKCILLDVKCGSGSFIHTPEEAESFAREMLAIGEAAGRRMMALVTEMDKPLGYAIGNVLEVKEALDMLHGRGPEDFREVVLTAASALLYLSRRERYPSRETGMAACRREAEESIATGRAFEKLQEIIAAQGGDTSYLLQPGKWGKAKVQVPLPAPTDGYITHMNTALLGRASVALGAGRLEKTSSIDPLAGIMLRKKTGDAVTEGETLAVFHTSFEEKAEQAAVLWQEALTFGEEPPHARPPVLALLEP